MTASQVMGVAIVVGVVTGGLTAVARVMGWPVLRETLVMFGIVVAIGVALSAGILLAMGIWSL